MANAVGNEVISRVVGYSLTGGDFSTSSPNLPQRIAIIAEANTANQTNLSIAPTVITSAKQAGDLYGYGSPIYSIMRILRPSSGGGVQGIPTVVYPVAEPAGATAKAQTITVTGTATASVTHFVKISGRTSLDGQFYKVGIFAGDTATDVAATMRDAINNVLGSPVKATAATAVVTATAKWKGKTSDGLTIEVFTDGNDAGLTYVVASTVTGAGIPASISTQLSSFADEWNTIVINGYGTESSIMQALIDFNGKPDETDPTGRYAPTVFKPFIALTGTLNANDGATIGDVQRNELTIALCPAPNSPGMHYEAAANYARIFSRISQDTPHLDVAGMFLPDMPVTSDPSTLPDFTQRDSIVKQGNTTVDVSGGRYRVQDFVTTYHPVGEIVPQFRYCRNLMLDFNVRYGYLLLEQVNVVDHSIAADNDVVYVEKVVKPKQWKAILNTYADDLSKRNLIVDPSFMKKSITVDLSTVNPDRFNSFFRYKRSGFVRVSSTVAQAGFNFGTLN